MERPYLVGAALLAAGLTVSGCATTGGSGWITLIDGEKGLENFNRVGDANWRAEGGAIVADKGKGGYLVSKSSYVITVKDTHVRLVLNGVETATGYDSQLASGPVALQFANRGKEPGGVIKWRKLEIRPL